jgi:hypothetical protein
MEEGLGMKSHRVEGVKSSVSAFDEYDRLMRERDYVRVKTKKIPNKTMNKRVNFHVEKISDAEFDEMLTRAGTECYSPEFRAALIKVHSLVKECYGSDPLRTRKRKSLRPIKKGQSA